MATELSRGDALRLQQLEKVVDDHVVSWAAAANALREIRDRKLYAGKGTFDEYVTRRFPFGRAHAYRLIEAVAVPLSPVGDIDTTQLGERHCRELVGLDENEVADVLTKAADMAIKRDDGKKVPTSAQLKKAREQLYSVPDEDDEVMEAWEEAAEDVEAAIRGLKDAAKKLRANRQRGGGGELDKEWGRAADQLATLAKRLADYVPVAAAADHWVCLREQLDRKENLFQK